jgi:hypothetical protein
MTTYSLLITGTREELLAFLGAGKKDTPINDLMASVDHSKGDRIKMPPNGAKCQEEAKRAFCTQADQDGWGDNISCAICGKDLDGRQKWMDNGIAFCGELCAYEYRASECPISNDLLGKENISKPNRSLDDEAHKQVLAYIRSCLRHGLDYSDILFSLKQLKGISLSPAELAGYLEEIAPCDNDAYGY